MNFDIISHQGAGPVRFGMRPEEIRKIIALPFSTFKRSPEDSHPCDKFPDTTLFSYYNSTGEAEAFEFAKPAKVTFGPTDLLGEGFAGIVEKLRVLDPDIELESSGFTSFALGFGAYAPNCSEDPLASPESIIVFPKGYYD
jgi:hypothetical protein